MISQKFKRRLRAVKFSLKKFFKQKHNNLSTKLKKAGRGKPSFLNRLGPVKSQLGSGHYLFLAKKSIHILMLLDHSITQCIYQEKKSFTLTIAFKFISYFALHNFLIS